MSISRVLHRLQSIFRHNPSIFVIENRQMSWLIVILITISKEGDADLFRELLQLLHLSQDAHAVVTPSPGHIPLFKDAYPSSSSTMLSHKKFHHNYVSKIKSKVRNMSY